MKSSDGKSGSLEETAEAVSMHNLIAKNSKEKVFLFRFVVEVVNVFPYVLITKMPMKSKHYFNVLLTNKMVV